MDPIENGVEGIPSLELAAGRNFVDVILFNKKIK